MRGFWNKILAIITGMFALFKTKDPVVYSAAVAFFTIFSMPSIIIVIVFLARLIQQDEEIKNELVEQIQNFIGREGSEVAIIIIDNISVAENDALATTFSVVILFISATAIFNFIQKGLNAIWEVKPKPEKGLLKFLTDRLLSFSLIVILGFIMLVSLIIDAIFNLVSNFMVEHLTLFATLIMTLLNVVVSFVVVMLIFFLIFKFLPDALIRAKDALIGAVMTAFLFTIGKYAIGIVLTTADLANTYAAAGSLAGLLVWVFYSSILLFVGSIFTKVYSEQLGRKIVPSKAAVKVDVKESEIEND
jgi:membrane protein